jgi:sulfur carrier protein
MIISVNGQPQTLEKQCNIAELLSDRGLAKAACAVEVNRRLVPKRDHGGHYLAEGDCVEIVTLVGGG